MSCFPSCPISCSASCSVPCPGSCSTACDTPSFCPFPEWIHPLLCNPTHLCCAGHQNGPTLVIHSILLEPCGDQSCTPRTLRIRITGPSYPCGETFTLRVGSCTEIDEPLVITGLQPGEYRIEQILSCCREFDTTFTGPICNGFVTITACAAPTVITIVNRKRGGSTCGCGNTCGCNHGCGNTCDGCHSCGCSHTCGCGNTWGCGNTCGNIWGCGNICGNTCDGCNHGCGHTCGCGSTCDGCHACSDPCTGC